MNFLSPESEDDVGERQFERAATPCQRWLIPQKGSVRLNIHTHGDPHSRALLSYDTLAMGEADFGIMPQR
jgi:hypothetical protein